MSFKNGQSANLAFAVFTLLFLFMYLTHCLSLSVCTSLSLYLHSLSLTLFQCPFLFSYFCFSFSNSLCFSLSLLSLTLLQCPFLILIFIFLFLSLYPLLPNFSLYLSPSSDTVYCFLCIYDSSSSSPFLLSLSITFSFSSVFLVWHFLRWKLLRSEPHIPCQPQKNRPLQKSEKLNFNFF